MYTIKEAAARSGVGAPLIRAWERRYGVVRPTRTDAGYRLYDDATIGVLVAMRSLTESGWTASEAARAIAAGEVDVAALATTGTAGAGGSDPIGAAHRDRLIARFVTAAEANSAADTEATLDEILASGSFESVIDDVLLPAAAALGDAWAAGRLSVAGEHAASQAVERRLAAAFQAAGAPGRVSAVVGLPPGSHHELGALAFAAALRRRGVGVLYLGADVTVDGWVDALARTRARAAVIGVVTPDDRTSAALVVTALLARDVPLVAVGGAAASLPLGEAPGVVRVADRVVDAAATVTEAVGGRRR
jgi:DNA-binding transcriptional MerR regulator/methylmalonyl-CoA mutase cobalamin-binding subunit